MKTRFLLCALFLGPAGLLSAAPLTESTFTEVVHDVNVVTLPANSATPAQVNGVFKSPDVVRTGAASRAELTAPDQTITRIGANTAFSFEPAGRDLDLEQGSVLFHSPTGKGGGTIKSGGASAAVLGTTLIVTATPVVYPGDKNGFKVILLEGHGLVKLKNGKHMKLKAGQLIFVLPGQDHFGPLLDINLAKFVGGCKLVNGFSHPLASLGKINAAIEQQQKDIAGGQAEDTGISPDNFAWQNAVSGNDSGALDVNLYQAGVLFPLVKQQQHLITVRVSNSDFPQLVPPPPLNGNALPPPFKSPAVTSFLFHP